MKRVYIVNIKYPIGTSIFAINLTLNFCVTVADADIENVKYLHIFLKNYLYHLLVKSEQNRMVRTTRNFELFKRKNADFFYKP